jgi:hypothetical protein
MLRGKQRGYVDPMSEPVPIPVQTGAPGGIMEQIVPEDLQFNPAQTNPRPFRQDDAVTLRGTPVGAMAVKTYHAFPPSMMFFIDDELKPVPPPNVTQAVRRSLFAPYQRWHYQFHINRDWGRKNGRYPRFSFINLIANTGNQEQQLNTNQRYIHGVQGMRPAPRFTRVLGYPRVDATPDTYGSYGP